MPQLKGSSAKIVRERKAFGRALRLLRLEVKLTQEELAFASGIHPTHISVLEKGHASPSLHTILALSRGLELSSTTLIRKTNKELEMQKRLKAARSAGKRNKK